MPGPDYNGSGFHPPFLPGVELEGKFMKKLGWRLGFLILFSCGAMAQRAVKSTLAATPPMGWNSWDSFALGITQRQFKAQARFMARHLARDGWRYMVVDEGWYLRNPYSNGRPAWQYVMNHHGLYQPAPNRFPSAQRGRGFRPLAHYIHSLGLRFGLHIVRGIPRAAVKANLPIAGSHFRASEAANPADVCPWNSDNYGVRDNAAGQAYYDSMARQWASWHVDFVKVDCIAAHPYKGREIAMIARAIRRSGRPILLSLSPGAAPLSHAIQFQKFAQMWRIADDFWDHWGKIPQIPWSQSLYGQFINLAAWQPFAGPGHWPDADMLPIGWLGPHPGLGPPRQSHFTRPEVRTLLTLWAMGRSPLIMGGNLLHLSPWLLRQLTNRAVIAVDQHTFDNHALITTADRAIWLARPDQGSGVYVALFNRGARKKTFTESWQQLGLPAASYQITNLWTGRGLGRALRLHARIAPHAALLYRLTP